MSISELFQSNYYKLNCGDVSLPPNNTNIVNYGQLQSLFDVGMTGATGPIGPTGSVGATGSIGATGATGESGTIQTVYSPTIQITGALNLEWTITFVKTGNLVTMSFPYFYSSTTSSDIIYLTIPDGYYNTSYSQAFPIYLISGNNNPVIGIFYCNIDGQGKSQIWAGLLSSNKWNNESDISIQFDVSYYI